MGGFYKCIIECVCYIKDREQVLASEERLCCVDVVNMRNKLLSVHVLKFCLSCPCVCLFF